MITFLFTVQETPETVEQRGNDQTPDLEEEQKKLKLAKLNKLMAAFSIQQIQALRSLLQMPPADRDAALNMFLSPQPQSPQVAGQLIHTPQNARNRRHDSRGSASSHSSRDDGSVCSQSSHSSRVHVKDAPKKLAAFLAKRYFASHRVWDHLYNDLNRVDNTRLNSVLQQVEKNLSSKQKKTLRENRAQVKKFLKKKIAAGRNYRSKLPKEKKKKLEAPMAHTIDLTVSDEDEDTQGDDNGEDIKDEKDAKAEKDVKAKAETPDRRKMLAKKFVQKMASLRGKRKKKMTAKSTARVTRSRRKRARKTNDNVETTKKSTTSSARKSTTSSARKTNDDVESTPTKKSTTSSARESTTSSDQTSSPGRWKERQLQSGTLKVGSKVSGQWSEDDDHKGEWYDGVVKSIDTEAKTCHIVFKDGDDDHALEWGHLRIL